MIAVTTGGFASQPHGKNVGVIYERFGGEISVPPAMRSWWAVKLPLPCV